MFDCNKYFLFLDFDGVLHPFTHQYGFFSHLPLFENAIKHSDLHIVISSAWRLDYSFSVIKSFFPSHLADKIIGITPNLDNNKRLYVRELEINQWLKKHTKSQGKWIALDDSPALFTPGCNNLISVNPETGFNEDTHNKLIAKIHYDK